MIKSLVSYIPSFLPISKLSLRQVMLTMTLGASVTLSGCSLFSVYKIDLPQGTPITQTEAQKLQVGMNQNQVIYLLGSPAIRDTLAPNRWDYIYDYKAGTVGEREGVADVKNASQHLIVYFDGNGIVTRIEGLESLTTS